MLVDNIRSTILDNLQSGHWTQTETLYHICIPLVPPGPAKRKYEIELKHSQKKSGTSADSRLSIDEQIRSGAKTIVRERIKGLVKSGIVERKVIDGKTFYRICPDGDQEDGRVVWPRVSQWRTPYNSHNSAAR